MRIFNDAWLPTGSGTRGRHVSLQAGVSRVEISQQNDTVVYLQCRNRLIRVRRHPSVTRKRIK